MNYLEYLPIFVFILIAVGLSAGFAVLSGFVGPNNPDKEKLSEKVRKIRDLYENLSELYQSSKISNNIPLN